MVGVRLPGLAGLAGLVAGVRLPVSPEAMVGVRLPGLAGLAGLVAGVRLPVSPEAMVGVRLPGLPGLAIGASLPGAAIADCPGLARGRRRVLAGWGSGTPCLAFAECGSTC